LPLFILSVLLKWLAFLFSSKNELKDNQRHLREQSINNHLKLIKMQEGTVKFFNESKGFGFITDADTGKDVFVHVSGLIDEIRENDRVRYNTEQGKKGINAVNVEVI
jgi:CspA family cold shock protein